ncbi:uncharacterized protein AAGF69_016842 [Amazona ochrocephala]
MRNNFQKCEREESKRTANVHHQRSPDTPQVGGGGASPDEDRRNLTRSRSPPFPYTSCLHLARALLRSLTASAMGMLCSTTKQRPRLLRAEAGERLRPPPAAPFQSAARWLREAGKGATQNAGLGPRAWAGLAWPGLAWPGLALVGRTWKCHWSGAAWPAEPEVLSCPREPPLEPRPRPNGAEVISAITHMDETLQSSDPPCRRHGSRGPNDPEQAFSQENEPEHPRVL